MSETVTYPSYQAARHNVQVLVPEPDQLVYTQTDEGWFWFGGDDDRWCIGPFPSRKAAADDYWAALREEYGD